jgi:putative FmdB family regulatory protein
MPIYEFRCDHCQQVFELLATKKEDQVSPVCPDCGSPDIARVLSRVNVAVGTTGGPARPRVQERSCASGSCSTIEIPGPTK